jgi:DUF971 family protein
MSALHLQRPADNQNSEIAGFTGPPKVLSLMTDAKQPEECPPPKSIERLPAEQALLIAWHDGLEAKLPLVELRAQCMCARCVDEVTGERIVDIGGIDPGIAIDAMQLVGNYALKIRWSDGHDTGLYTWPHLRELCHTSPKRKRG